MLDRATLGALLRAGRSVRGVKQSDLASSIPVTSPALSHVESGRNLPSDRILHAYAEVMVGPETADELVELLLRMSPSEIGAVADLVCPEDPQRFLAEYRNALGKAAASPQSRPEPTDKLTKERLSELLEAFEEPRTRSFGMRSSSQMFSRPTKLQPLLRIESRISSQTKTNLQTTEETLAEFVEANGGQTLSTKTKSYEFGTGVDFRCDLVDIRHRVAYEIKSLDRLVGKTVAEFIGKAALLRKQDFRFVVCLTTPPSNEQQETTISTLKENGVLVIWPSGLPGFVGYFRGDSIY